MMRPAGLVSVRLALCFSLTACNDGGGPGPGGSGGGPLEITAVVPAANASDAEALATVAAVFNQGINPATLTTTTFRVKHNGTPIPTGLTWDASARTARAPAALLPGQTYEVEVSTGVQTPGGSSLAAPEVWNFTTRTWQAVSVGPDVAIAPSIAREANGRLHVVYEDGTSTNTLDLKYATCATACEVAANWQVVAVDTADWMGETPSVAVDGAGRVHIAYGGLVASTFDFKYATCATACTVAANWQIAVVDTGSGSGADEGLLWYSLAVDAAGRVHVSYHDGAQPLDLKYGTCATACATAANWQKVTLDTALTGPGSLAVDGNDRVHIAYFKRVSSFPYLAYATCAAACGLLGSWQMGAIQAPVAGQPAVDVERSGQVHVVFPIDLNQSSAAGFGYAHCAGSCTVGTNWVWATVDPTIRGGGAAVGVDTTGRVHVTYYNTVTNELRYSSCVVNCAVGTLAWRSVIQRVGAVTGPESLEVGTDGRLHVAYIPSSAGAGMGFWYLR